jgi:mRNA-degrading endonuclease toxin of MazEF toxin-antitoxin module
MENINNLDTVNKYVNGSVWKRINNQDKKNNDDSLVLIISNNTFNQRSPVVNCLYLTNFLKDNPVHVPLFISTDSHVQCEQIHTISKKELGDFKGVVPTSVMSNVRAKLALQFCLYTDRNAEILDGYKEDSGRFKQQSGA